MKSFSMLISLSAFALAVEAFTPARPCLAYPTKVSKLRACPTASAFCSKYLGGPASFTRTSTSTTTALGIVATATSYSDTVTVTAPASTVTSTTISTTTTFAVTCAPTTTPQRRAIAARAQAQSSCGLASNAVPSQVSGACNCILASSTTTIITTTAAPLTTTITTQSTATVTPTSTETDYATATACSNTFYLHIQADKYNGAYLTTVTESSGFHLAARGRGDTGAEFALDPSSGQLSLAPSGDIAYISGHSGQADLVYFDIPEVASSHDAANCFIGPDGYLSCNAAGEDVFSVGENLDLYLSDQQDTGNNIVSNLQVIPVAQ